MNILFIDTSSNKEIRLELRVNSKVYVLKKNIGKQKAQVVLPMVDQLLKKHKLTIGDIGEIRVNTGPGSFTGLRVGISVANAFAFSLKIPINGLPLGEFVEPVYE